MSDLQIEHAYVRLVRNIDSILAQMETLGETEMGILQEHLAGSFHDATDKLRDLAHDLKQCAYWPHKA